MLRCDTCGFRTRDEGLCEGCGAQRGPRVTLEDCEPDGRWILSGRGGSDQVLKQVARALSATSSPHGPARLAVLRRLLTAFPCQGQIEVRLDLRGAEAGALHSTRRRGNSRETFHRLPWLWLRSLDLEASVTRTLHRKVVRTFRSGVESSATRFELDELRLRTPSGGIRRPFRRPSSLAGIGPADLEPFVPGLDEPLIASAPGVGGEAPGGTAAALVAAVVLLLVVPSFLLPPPTIPPLPGERYAPRTVRHALAARDPHQRRVALGLLGALPRNERYRALRAAASDPLPDVQERALEELSKSPLGTAYLADRCGAAAPLGTRLRAFTLLRVAAPSRARRIALDGLATPASPRLLRAWALGLGELCRPGDAEAAEVLAEVLGRARPSLGAAAAR
ncbi:MAG: hypothetical protein JKY65_26410, partial [Planctomycetes bacterium]|nr:hypothetical protein [Planctomycetota bacterium]